MTMNLKRLSLVVILAWVGAIAFSEPGISAAESAPEKARSVKIRSTAVAPVGGMREPAPSATEAQHVGNRRARLNGSNHSIAPVFGTGRSTAASAHPNPRGGTTLVVDDDGMGIATDCDDSTSCFSSIQAAIDAAGPGDTILVFPGNYDETASNRGILGGAPNYQFGLFVPFTKPNLTIRGVECNGTPITDASNVVAHITTHATNGFGPSNTFIEADGVTLSGLDFGSNLEAYPNDINKTIEVIGDAITIQYSVFTDYLSGYGGGTVYINDWQVNDNGTPGNFADDISHIQSYHIEENLFPNGEDLAIASGAGVTGPVSGRQIANNHFDSYTPDFNGDWPNVSFNGSAGACVPWFVYSVGGAELTGNSFENNALRYIQARGGYDNSQFDWESYWNDNTFDKKTVTLVTLSPFTPRSYAYSCFTNVRRIGATIQDEIDTIAVSGDTVLVGSGTYNELVQVDLSLSLLGEQHGVDARTRGVVPESTIANGDGDIQILADGVTVDGFTLTGVVNDPNMIGTSLGAAIWSNPGFSGTDGGHHLLNNIIEDNIAGIELANSGVLQTVVEQNLIQNNNASGAGSGSGIRCDFSLANGLIDNNKFVNNTNASIILFGGSGNTISNNTADNSIALLSMTNTDITGNTLVNPLYDGIYVFGGNDGVDISDNEVIDPITAGSAGVFLGNPYEEYAVSPNSNVSIANNKLHCTASTYGVLIDTAACSDGCSSPSVTAYNDPDPLVILENDLSGAGPGIKNDQPALAVDASANYWATSNPGTVSITGVAASFVDFTPLLDNDESLANQSVVGFQPNLSSLTVHTSGFQTGGSGRIQEGIDRVAANGTVHILAGTYSGGVSTAGNAVSLSLGASPAQVTINGNLTLDGNDTVPIELFGTNPATDFDNFIVNGTVTLGGATLTVSRGMFSPPNMTSFTIIDNDGGDAVSGTFAGLAEGAIINVSGIPFTISYVGGTGNDVVLTSQVAATLSISYDRPCYKPGDTLTATLRMSGLSAPAAGFQAFLQLDSSRLTFTGWSYTCEPFASHVINAPIFVNPPAHPTWLNFASGIDTDGTSSCCGDPVLCPQSPTMADDNLVSITFTVGGSDTCSIGGLLSFRMNNPPTRLTDINGQELSVLATIVAPAITIDGTAPVIQCSDPVTVDTDAGVCSASLATLLSDFDGTPGSPTFAADGNGVSELSSAQSYSPTQSGRLFLPSGAADFAKIILPVTGKTVGNLSGMFKAYITPGSAPNVGPYMYWMVDSNGNNTFDFTGNDSGDSFVIAFQAASTPYQQGRWYTDGLNGSMLVHVVGGRLGLNPNEFSSSNGGGLLSDLRAHNFDGMSVWGDKNVLAVRVGAGEWPGAGQFEAFIDDIYVARELEIPATVSDNCGAIVTATRSDILAIDAPYPKGTTTITWAADDCSGNHDECMQTVTVEDHEKPIIACHNMNITQSNDMGLCSASVTWNAATATDNCDPNPTIVYDIDVNNDGLMMGDGDTTQATTTFVFPVGTHKVTAVATDNAVPANSNSCSFLVTVVDAEAPVLTCGQIANISVNASAGLCQAQVTWAAATATDNCDPSPTIAYEIDLGNNGGAPDVIQGGTTYTFPVGTHSVTARATDHALVPNSSTCPPFLVIVSGNNEMICNVEFSPTLQNGVQRCIKFEFFECPTATPMQTVDVPVTITANFASNNMDGYVHVLVPCGSYACVTARDKLHTLRSTSPTLTINMANQYVADFTGKRADEPGATMMDNGHRLISGNLNDDIFVDILDFGTWAGLYQHNYGTGNTTCMTPIPHADFSGDGEVTNADFGFIYVNFLLVSENNCCSMSPLAPRGGEGAGPITSISVKELHERGLDSLIAGDVNQDGVLDVQDVVAVFFGTVPQPPQDANPITTIRPLEPPVRPTGNGSKTPPSTRG